jgi:hypothetical protein
LRFSIKFVLSESGGSASIPRIGIPVLANNLLGNVRTKPPETFSLPYTSLQQLYGSFDETP